MSRIADCLTDAVPRFPHVLTCLISDLAQSGSFLHKWSSDDLKAQHKADCLTDADGDLELLSICGMQGESRTLYSLYRKKRMSCVKQWYRLYSSKLGLLVSLASEFDDRGDPVVTCGRADGSVCIFQTTKAGPYIRMYHEDGKLLKEFPAAYAIQCAATCSIVPPCHQSRLHRSKARDQCNGISSARIRLWWYA